MVRNMTKGSPVKLLLAFALPLLVANVFQQLYSVADAMVLGRGVGVNALAAAGSTGSVHFFVLGFINGLTHGYSILISQRFGAGDESDMRRTVMNAGYLGFMSAAVITALSLIFSRPLMTLMGTPTDIFDDALLYIRIIFIGIFTTVFYNMLSSILRALGDSMSPLIIILISSAVNIGLDILFVMAFKWGVAGAAWATVLAQLLSGLMCLFVLCRMPVLRFKADEKRMDKSIIFGLLKLGLPVGIMNSITAIGGMILQGIVNGLGSTIVAAYTAGSKIFGLAEQPCNIIGLSLGTYVGQNLGAGRVDRINRRFLHRRHNDSVRPPADGGVRLRRGAGGHRSFVSVFAVLRCDDVGAGFAVRLPLFPAKSRRHGGADALRRAGANSAHFRCARAL